MEVNVNLSPMSVAVIITGASRGFGRCLALDFVREIQDAHIEMHLLARNENDLSITQQMVQEEWKEKQYTLHVHVNAVDLSQHSDYVPKIDALLAQLTTNKPYNHIYLVHNAGSLGQLGVASTCISPTILNQYFELNVTSVMWINGRFLELLRSKSLVSSHATIINITSLCAIEPFRTHNLYCSGKASREMHHRVIAAEQEKYTSQEDCQISILNYSPGPMDTEMQKTLRESNVVDSELSNMFQSMKTNGTLIPPAISSQRGVRFVLYNSYPSGAHIDYYDIVE